MCVHNTLKIAVPATDCPSDIFSVCCISVSVTVESGNLVLFFIWVLQYFCPGDTATQRVLGNLSRQAQFAVTIICPLSGRTFAALIDPFPSEVFSGLV